MIKKTKRGEKLLEKYKRGKLKYYDIHARVQFLILYRDPKKEAQKIYEDISTRIMATNRENAVMRFALFIHEIKEKLEEKELDKTYLILNQEIIFLKTPIDAFWDKNMKPVEKMMENPEEWEKVHLTGEMKLKNYIYYSKEREDEKKRKEEKWEKNKYVM